MMKLIGVGRIGKDVELRYTAGGEPMCKLSLAWNYGAKDEAGKMPSQWVIATLFGKRAESLAPYLKKGVSLFVDLKDVHVKLLTNEEGKHNPMLIGIVDSVAFAGDRLKESPPSGSGRRHDPANNPETFDDSIPF
jgi:single-strand DNA-binding protein